MQGEKATYTKPSMENQDPIAPDHDKHPNHKTTTQPTTSPSPSPSPHSKPCTICHTPRNVLIRCQIDQTKKWHFVCTGKCWRDVSGGTVDGDGDGAHSEYRYGGMWKNKHEAVSGRIKGKAKERNWKRGKSAAGLGENVGEREEGI